jgi:hypothetical protein
MITIGEAAAHFRCSERWLRSFVKKHPHYRKAGRAYVFSKDDIEELAEAMRPEPTAGGRASTPASPSRREVQRRLAVHRAKKK